MRRQRHEIPLPRAHPRRNAEPETNNPARGIKSVEQIRNRSVEPTMVDKQPSGSIGVGFGFDRHALDG
ncbi:hypothetical protein SmB9_29530 [Sphingosinicella microcystinivorans]|uniref:Uncharacterized protein n=1 Tax=Sphingosinicella microcystinivorans TaxID=335406 RepID=A0AAD1D860_SPHMI|nr:hypothetical protein SmB9_29530 [Sphingosinicella microcystinivorans]